MLEDYRGGGGNELPVVLTGFLQRESRIESNSEEKRKARKKKEECFPWDGYNTAAMPKEKEREEEIEIEAFACRC